MKTVCKQVFQINLLKYINHNFVWSIQVPRIDRKEEIRVWQDQ